MPSHVAQLVQAKRLELARDLKWANRKLDLAADLERLDVDGSPDDRLVAELMLFDLFDRDATGTLSISELADGTAGAGELSKGLTYNELIEVLTAADADKVDRAAFGHLLESVVQARGGSFKQWCIYLALSYIPPCVNLPPAEAMARPAGKTGAAASPGEDAVSAAAADPRMMALFALFDADADGKCSFREVACGLRRIAPHVPLEAAAEAAVRVLLDFGNDPAGRTALDFAQFVHFIAAFLQAGGLEFGQVADALVAAAARPAGAGGDDDVRLAKECEALEGMHYTDRRMHALFGLLDRDSDGTLSFKELATGLRRFEPTKPLAVSVAHAASLLRAAGGAAPDDPEADAPVDCHAFAAVVTAFCRESGAEFDQVADYLVTLSTAAPTDAEAEAAPGWFFRGVSGAR